VTGYDYAQNLVVVHTIPGLADAAASAVDAMSLPFVLGTIGGDDTVLIILRDTNAAAAFCTEMKNLLD
jgi:transcriptional regulator of arginine metabolism